MTSLLSPPRAPRADDVRRPLTLLASAGGAVAAASVLLTCLGVGVVGWFLTDAGAHGEPRDGLRAAATAWLMAHGSGVHVRGVPVTAVPLGLTLICAWVTWRWGLRVGEAISGHGPDADALADGERDWTVPAAMGLFSASYVVVAVLTGVLAGTATSEPALGPVVGWSLTLTVLVGGTAISVGSGRAAVWMALVPEAVRASVHGAVRMLGWFLAVSALTFVVALLLDFGAAMNVMSRLHTDLGDAALFSLLICLVLPNAVLFSGSYLLGPGFTVGTGTLVSPSVVALGPVPMFPLLAALPDNGATPAWTPWLVLVPVLCAAFAAAGAHRRHPTLAWDHGALRGGVSGVLGGVAIGVLAGVAGGAVGPGRMADVGPLAGQVMFHAIVSFGIGGLLGGLFATWRLRRGVDVSTGGVSDDTVEVFAEQDRSVDPAGIVGGVLDGVRGGVRGAMGLPARVLRGFRDGR